MAPISKHMNTESGYGTPMRPIFIRYTHRGRENEISTDSLPTALAEIRAAIRSLILHKPESGGIVRVEISLVESANPEANEDARPRTDA